MISEPNNAQHQAARQSQQPKSLTARVQSARRLLAAGFFDQPDVLDAAAQRLLARLGESGDLQRPRASPVRGSEPAPTSEKGRGKVSVPARISQSLRSRTSVLCDT